MKLLLAPLGLLALQSYSSDAWTTGGSLQRLVPAAMATSRRSMLTVTWAQPPSQPVSQSQRTRDENATGNSFDPLHLSSSLTDNDTADHLHQIPFPALLLGALAIGTPEMASAAAPDAVPSALAAYGHYLSIILIVSSIMTERLTVKAAMSIEDEKLLGAADIFTGVAGLLLVVSGYYRATAYGKGWDFYSHEPVFWLKMTFLGIFGALSLFPTIIIIQRTVKIQQEGTIEPMSEELATRMKKVLNAELSALAFIPLTASLMARGVGYINDFPTQIVGPGLFGVVTAGAVYKYVKDAITWKEEP